ncbi:hypothetical protein Nepgr_002540 [Nepenthes gracilis]|uniref:Uncharacterized protein n=1 Tax=Nepenthes gracilis TaxID=150966 RepID=A0AAD3P6G2_NEPGR|nr:hypothetical protein Nepgr_002540 [Nepenthes gracilis]
MNDHCSEYSNKNPFCCYFHPNEDIVGVCHLCLKERLLILAAKQGRKHHHRRQARRSGSVGGGADLQRKPPPFTLHKIFAFGSLLRSRKSQNSDHHLDASTSLEDSFISIKFEENGAALWENGKASKVFTERSKTLCDRESFAAKEANAKAKSVVEHAKPRLFLGWRKKIGQLFQLIRRKKSGKANVPVHVGDRADGAAKVRRFCTWRRTKD